MMKKTKRINKGFTLVELLAVIVILAIIMIIAIPAVLNTMQTAQRKTFGEFIQKVYNVGERKFIEDTSFNNIKVYSEGYYVYSIQDDLGMNNTGDYKGIFYVFQDAESTNYKIALYNKDLAFFERVYDSTSNINMDELINNDIYTIDELNKHYNDLGYPSTFDIRNFQKDTFINYLKMDYYNKHCKNKETLSNYDLNFRIVDAGNPDREAIPVCE